MSATSQRLLTALGLAVTYLLAFIVRLVEPSHDFVYHLKGAPSAVFLPALLDILVLTLLLFALLTVTRRSRRLRHVIPLSLLAWMPWFLFRYAASVSDWLLPLWLSSFTALLTLLVCVAFFFVPVTSPLLGSAQQLAGTLLTFCGLSGLLVLARLAWFAVATCHISQPPALHKPVSAGRSVPHSGRVIWVLLDELSFDQVYEHRYPGLDLPAFDVLAAQSTLFTHTVAAEIATEKVIPSLLTGLPVDAIKTSADGELVALHDPNSQLWRPFNPTQTIFGDALRLGYKTSVIGWYNPYCRILAPVLDRCFWSDRMYRPTDMRPDASFDTNVLRPLSVAWNLFRARFFGVSRENTEREDHLDDFLLLDAAASRALADPSQSMLLLHMPIPHPPAFFNRHTHSLQTTPGPSYIDSLALTDIWLGHLKEQLTRQGEWDVDTLVLMGDHSWRTALIWGHSALWTPEDERASHNLQFDDRPLYLVKLPGQQHAARIEVPFRAIRTRSLLNNLLDNSIESPSDLQAWVRNGK